MPDLGHPQLVLWMLCVAAQVCLLALLLFRRNYRTLPALTGYLLVNLGQSVVLFQSYLSWGFSADATARLAWLTQALVVFTRALAVGELCWRILGAYRGVWALAWRILGLASLVILAHSSFLVSRHWDMAILAADRGFELVIAASIVILFVFIRYYRVPVPGAERGLALGFCLFSCFGVINNTLLESLLLDYGMNWNSIGSLMFLASVCIWILALRRPLPESLEQPSLLEQDVYQQLSPQINQRLRTLNENLAAFWNSRASQP